MDDLGLESDISPPALTWQANYDIINILKLLRNSLNLAFPPLSAPQGLFKKAFNLLTISIDSSNQSSIVRFLQCTEINDEKIMYTFFPMTHFLDS